MRNKFVVKRLTIARKLARQLKREYGRNITAIGIIGSVAREKAEQYSDIDLEIIVKKATPESYQSRIIENTYCSLTFVTRRSVIQEITRPDPDLPERLGGYTRIRPIYDPAGFLRTLEAKARHVPPRVFRRSAELALLHSYEDFCRVKNAYLDHDEGLLRDNANYVTHSASLIVASLNNAYFVSDREIFKAYKRFNRLPRGFTRINDIRYGHLKPKKLLETTMALYLDVIEFCSNEGIQFPVDQEYLRSLTM